MGKSWYSLPASNRVKKLKELWRHHSDSMRKSFTWTQREVKRYHERTSLLIQRHTSFNILNKVTMIQTMFKTILKFQRTKPLCWLLHGKNPYHFWGCVIKKLGQLLFELVSSAFKKIKRTLILLILICQWDHLTVFLLPNAESVLISIILLHFFPLVN